MAATSSLQLRAISNFGTLSATATINCEFKIIIEIEIGICRLLLVFGSTPLVKRASRQVFIQLLFKLGGFRLCENRQGGSFSARGHPAGTIDIKLQASGNDNVEILFFDDGCGMSLGVKRKAFHPFFTTRHDQGGTSLDLHIVCNIVTNCLGGRLNLDSESGQGTKIQMILSRMAPTQASVKWPLGPEHSNRQLGEGK